MKSIQKYRTLIILFIAFVFFNTVVMSDSGWVDENNNIYSHVDGKVGIGTDSPIRDFDIWCSGPDGGVHIERNDGYYDDTNVSILISSHTSGHGLRFQISNDDDETNKDVLFLQNDSKVGIGTSDPGAMCHIKHSSSGYTPSNINVGLFIENNGSSNSYYVFQTATTGGGKSFSITNAGKVGIGTDSPDELLTVNGTIHAKEIIVDTDISADFVFEDGYKLAPLSEVEDFIEKEGHLPEIPCAKEVEENGVSLGEMNTKLLQKIEELTLYIIEQNKQLDEQGKRIAELEKYSAGSE